MIDIDKMKQKYQDLVRTLLEWITVKIEWLDDDVPRQSALLQKSMNEFKSLRTAEKPKKYVNYIMLYAYIFYKLMCGSVFMHLNPIDYSFASKIIHCIFRLLKCPTCLVCSSYDNSSHM